MVEEKKKKMKREMMTSNRQIRTSRDRSSMSTQSNSESKKGSIGPPPSYDGSRQPGVFEEFRIRAKLWLFTTNIECRARGPRLLQALSGKAFEECQAFD